MQVWGNFSQKFRFQKLIPWIVSSHLKPVRSGTLFPVQRLKLFLNKNKNLHITRIITILRQNFPQKFRFQTLMLCHLIKIWLSIVSPTDKCMQLWLHICPYMHRNQIIFICPLSLFYFSPSLSFMYYLTHWHDPHHKQFLNSK